MSALIIAIIFTLGVSAFCSLLEAMILSTTIGEVEALKAHHPKRGAMLERLRVAIEETSSAILVLNTVANTLGAVIAGGLATQIFGENNLIYFSLGMTLAILVFSEILPKNIGVIYRPSLQKHLVILLQGVCWAMAPVSWICRYAIRFFVPKRSKLESTDDEIILLAERSAKEGTLSESKSTMVANALRLDEVLVADIMTPRTVVEAIEVSCTVANVFETVSNVPFARLPVYRDSIDNTIGIVRRRDLLEAKARGNDDISVEALMQSVIFVPERATVAAALQGFLRYHYQLAVVVDEFGSVSGVIAMEDVVEHLLGQEIFEADDVAVDMRELARRKKTKKERENIRPKFIQNE